MNFVRAIGQSQNPSVAEQRGQREIIVADAGTAVNLNRIVHNLLQLLRVATTLLLVVACALISGCVHVA